MRAKDILGKTEGVLFTKYGEIPNLARSNWNLWKLAKDLTEQEIKVMIRDKKRQLRATSDQEEIKNLRRDIVLLSEAYKIKKRNRLRNLSNLEARVTSILNYLGFTQNTLYKYECINIVNTLNKGILDEEDLPPIVVAVVLDHYGVSYIFDRLLEFITNTEEFPTHFKMIKDICNIKN